MSSVARLLAPSLASISSKLPSSSDAERDVKVMLEAFKLQSIRRYFGQLHWTDETRVAFEADEAEPGLKLENVAAHSWHVADTALLISGHFLNLNSARIIVLALLHDKLEMYTGDFDPVGPDGQGTLSHAFCAERRQHKEQLERSALHRYLAALRPAARSEQRALFEELLNGDTQEARFVRAIDKLQALAFVIVKKNGRLSDQHLDFTLRYSAKATEYFPLIGRHYSILVDLLLHKVSAHRGISVGELVGSLSAARV